MNSIADTYMLSSGYEIPCVGYGTWQSPNDEIPDLPLIKKSVEFAVRTGYRHIDTAAEYGNEKSVGAGIKASGISRDELFITSKLWNDERGYDTTMAAFSKTLSDLGVDYLDLYLIHWPASPNRFDNWKELNSETWRAMEDLYRDGKIKSIGVSNFRRHHMDALLETARIVPMVNQIEFHPGFMQEDTVSYCRERNILIEAWSPLGNGDVLENSVLTEIGTKYGKTTAQICLRWVLQHGHLPLAKSITENRIVENTNIFDFTLKEEDMKTIDNMGFCGGKGWDPDQVDW